MTPPREDRHGQRRRSSSDDRVVLYVDGGLEGEERRAFEQELETSEELRAEVRRAGRVRDVVRTLPRVAPVGLPSAAELLERVEVEASPRVAALLGALPRRAAPAEVGARLWAVLATEAESVRAARGRARWRPTLATWAAAAALLLVATALVRGTGPLRPSGSRIAGVSYNFEVIRGRPGSPLDAGAARGLHHVPGFPPTTSSRGMGGRK